MLGNKKKNGIFLDKDFGPPTPPHPPSKVCKTQKCAKLKVCKTQMCAKPTCIAHALYSYARKPVESVSI